MKLTLSLSSSTPRPLPIIRKKAPFRAIFYVKRAGIGQKSAVDGADFGNVNKCKKSGKFKLPLTTNSAVKLSAEAALTASQV